MYCAYVPKDIQYWLTLWLDKNNSTLANPYDVLTWLEDALNDGFLS